MSPGAADRARSSTRTWALRTTLRACSQLHFRSAPPALPRLPSLPPRRSPEVLERSYGLPCDLWSVGVVAFMMLCGSPPFFGETPAQIYQ